METMRPLQTFDKYTLMCRENKYNFYGVLDGHGGPRASEFAKNDLSGRLARVSFAPHPCSFLHGANMHTPHNNGSSLFCDARAGIFVAAVHVCVRVLMMPPLHTSFAPQLQRLQGRGPLSAQDGDKFFHQVFVEVPPLFFPQAA